MDTLLALITFFSFIILIVGLFNPKWTLFWTNREKTRKKSSVIFGGITIFSFIIFAIITPENNNGIAGEKLAISKIGENKLEKEVNNNIQEWLNKQNKIEKYIEKKIDGKWIQLFSIYAAGENIKKNEFTDKVEKEGDIFGTCEFKDGMFPKYSYSFINNFTVNNPTDQLKEEGTYKVDKNKLTILLKDVENLVPKERAYNVAYISDNVLIYDSFNDFGSKDFLIFRRDRDNKDIALLETITFFDLERQKAYQLLGESALLFKEDRSLDADLKASLGQKLLMNYALIDNNFKIENDEILNGVLEIRKLKGKNVEDEYIELYKTKIKNLNFVEDKSPKYSTYVNGVKELLPELFSITASRKSSGLSYQKILTYTEQVKKQYDAYFKKYSLYGDGDTYLMKYAAEDAIKENLKDPSSFKLADAYPTDKKTNEGWVYYIKYRAKNSYGAIVLEDKNLMIKFSPERGVYYVTKIW